MCFSFPHSFFCRGSFSRFWCSAGRTPCHKSSTFRGNPLPLFWTTASLPVAFCAHDFSLVQQVTLAEGSGWILFATPPSVLRCVGFPYLMVG
ncbi:hypothetical protein A2U01_0042268, partial [Trifolium medium]|nr:hypothetical protein [Trifolium medium]